MIFLGYMQFIQLAYSQISMTTNLVMSNCLLFIEIQNYIYLMLYLFLMIEIIFLKCTSCNYTFKIQSAVTFLIKIFKTLIFAKNNIFLKFIIYLYKFPIDDCSPVVSVEKNQVFINILQITRDRGSTCSASTRRRGGVRFEFRPYNDVKNGSYCFYVRCTT